ncbi:uncharacterized protein LOC128865000 [Anastrepha ludens]|uniref:uncharacterized protein LOC128865000 n=1 Tax=Anastrepha ludens TaxID=28586 RepID=UPI0023B07B7E|nr:uncharacterized protein LOC128865000 [Anastrepha ludens]XP_053960811.1 uncharacterized protein LOC128865000 [Anastrepha ludens]XP_053960812.1 uncharacterized protein LOC128865000 [Anastrepha ludens]XP_053960813.1 uncharacterized protein LOC128865000 [Anastrepha ludens]XP_053960814.1 uncharacterized protein LOC128865000 [Anastrepha ludens]
MNAISKWNKYLGHSAILNRNTVISSDIDYHVSLPSPPLLFSCSLPTREEWKTNLTEIDGPLIIYTDGSKQDGKVGFGIFSNSPHINLSFRLSDYCSVFQAEVCAIWYAAKTLLENRISLEDIRFFTDSQAAVRALSSSYTHSDVVRSCLLSLNEISVQNSVQVIWIPGHSGFEGNCKADELARAGAAQSNVSNLPTIHIPLSTCKLLIDREFHSIADRRWRVETTCVTTRQIGPSYNLKQTKTLISLSKHELRHIISLITGHCLLGTHARRLGVPQNDLCRYCEDEDEEVSSRHLLCSCPGLARSRLALLGSPTIDNLSVLSNLKIESLIKFSKRINIFDQNPQ